jgi:hypothetical protein
MGTAGKRDQHGEGQVGRLLLVPAQTMPAIHASVMRGPLSNLPESTTLKGNAT